MADHPPSQSAALYPLEAPAQPTGFSPTQPSPAQTSQTLALRFTGSGSEYFRIWIVNLLLTLVTLTLYLPFARARRMAYFQNNTLVGGDPLGFHANPWAMFRGYLLVLLMGFVYWAVSTFVPALTWLPFLVLVAVWPAMWCASLQFRLRNTSWRGVRFDFLGDTKSAYFALLPPFVFVLMLMAGLWMLETENGDAKSQAAWGAVLVGACMLVLVLMVPWITALLTRYRQNGYAFAQQRIELKASVGSFYMLFLKAFGLVMLVSAAATVVALVFTLTLGASMAAIVTDPFNHPMMMVVLVVVAVFLYVLWPLALGAYMGSRLQNLQWGNSSGPHIRFHSQLRFAPLLKVMAGNWLFIVLTLGLYWPFAAIRAARLKLQALSVEVDGSVDDWVAATQAKTKGTLADAAGDFFGVDMGL